MTSPTDRVALRALDTALAFFAMTTILYWLILLLHAPAGWLIPGVFVALFVAVLWAVWSCRGQPSSALLTSQTAALFALSLATGAAGVFFYHSDLDDFSFLHRVLVQLSVMDQPFIMTDTTHDVGGLPPLSPGHVFTSLEPIAAFAAAALHLPLLPALMGGLACISLALLPSVYYLLLREHRLRAPAAIAGAAAVFVFFALSGSSHRDFGNFTIARAWQGKCILVMLILPALYGTALRYMMFGMRADLLRLHAGVIAALGVSGSGNFLAPYVVGGVTAAIALVGWRRPARLRRVPIVATVLIYPFGALIAAQAFPIVLDAWQAGWPLSRAENLQLVFVDASTTVLALAAVGLAVWLCPARPLGIVLGLTTVLMVGAALAPLTGDVLMHIVQPAGFWRLAYAFPVPLAAGIVGASAYDALVRVKLMPVLAAGLLFAAMAALKVPVLGRSNFVPFRATKFEPKAEAVARGLAGIAPQGGVTLAPERLVVILGLLRPDLRFIATRPGDTLIAFAGANRRDEATRRIQLQEWAADCPESFLDPPSDYAGIVAPVGLVVIASCGSDAARIRDVQALLQRSQPGSNWKVSPERGYVVLERVAGSS